jgi:hypothetical protein
MMQPEAPHCLGYPVCEFVHALFVRTVREDDQLAAVVPLQPRGDVTGPPQAPAYRLGNPAQARIGRMPSEDLEIRVEIVQHENDQAQRRFLAGRDRPIVAKDVPECGRVH